MNVYIFKNMVQQIFWEKKDASTTFNDVSWETKKKMLFVQKPGLPPGIFFEI